MLLRAQRMCISPWCHFQIQYILTMYSCDINIVATNYYDDFQHLISSRRAIVEALAADPHINATFWGLPYSGPASHKEAMQCRDYIAPGSSCKKPFKPGGILYQNNRKVFSSCKLTLNLLDVPPDACSNGARYENERVSTVMASGAVLIVENHPCHKGILENGQNTIFITSTEPRAVVRQVRDIIANFEDYETIRQRAMDTAKPWEITEFIHTFLADIHRLRQTKNLNVPAIASPELETNVKSSASPTQGTNAPNLKRSGPSFAIVTMLGKTSKEGYNTFNVYEQLSNLTLSSILAYGKAWGYPVFYQNDFLIDKSRHAYWSKIAIIQHYLELNEFDFVLYTDIDILITNHSKPLTDFVVEGFDLMGVNECKDRVLTNEMIRSGFMLFRNSQTSLQFLDAWSNMYADFVDIENPEQSALEILTNTTEWKDKVILLNWKTFHSYDTCQGGQASFSMHFPGKFKVERVARMVAWFQMIQSPQHLFTHHEQSMQNSISMSIGIIQQGLITMNEVPLDNMLVPYDLAGTMSLLHDAGYNAFTERDMFHLETARQNAWRYDETTYYWAIPNTIYFSVKDQADTQSTVLRTRLENWKKLNPGYTIIIHDDVQIKQLVLSLLPISEDMWNRLEPVQRVDIYRYTVIHTFGGWYFDADVDAVRSISKWGHEPHHTLVVGVEADNYADGGLRHEGVRMLTISQYAFGAAPQHPALGWAIETILHLGDGLVMQDTMSVQDRLSHVLLTTGPVVWTDAVVRFLSLATSARAQRPLPPNELHAGGQVLNTKIFPISGFGCGQGHSNSPECDQEGVNAWHIFGGSKYFHGKSWQAK